MVIGHTSLHESHQPRILSRRPFKQSIDQLLIASRECPLIPFLVFHRFYFLTIISILSIPFLST
jgi:hypothetical protein